MANRRASRFAGVMLVISASACRQTQSDRAEQTNPVDSSYSLDARRIEFVADSGTAIPILAGVRVGRHEGFERVVFEFRSRVPGYRMEYSSEPVVACGSGEPVQIEGERVFVVSFSPADAHEFDGEQARSSIPERELRPGPGAIRHLKLTCDFEAEVAWAIGLARPLPFRVTALDDGRRLAVDFRY